MKEIRATEIRANDPTAEEPKALIISGRPIVYDTPTTINDVGGSYTEIILRGALDSADLSDVRLLIGHDEKRLPLAKVPKTMSLSVDDQGLTMRATLPQTETGREAYEAIKREDLTTMSFAFKVPDGGDYYDAYTNTRTITKIEKVYECSLVNFPAYNSAVVSVESRSARQESLKLLEAKQKAKILVNQIMKAR